MDVPLWLAQPLTRLFLSLSQLTAAWFRLTISLILSDKTTVHITAFLVLQLQHPLLESFNLELPLSWLVIEGSLINVALG